MVKHLNITISGKVQGVGFRFSSQDQAQKLKITGFAKNQPDGLVYMEIEGEPEDLEKFVSWCKSGPNLAQVEKVEVLESKVRNFTEFKIS